MANEQVTITFSAGDRVGLSIATAPIASTFPAQVDLFAAQSNAEADEPRSAARSADARHVPAGAKKTPPAADPQAAEVKKPWEDLSRGAKGLNLPMSAELYAKMAWCTENVPKMSLQKLARQGAEAEADRLIALYYKP